MSVSQEAFDNSVSSCLSAVIMRVNLGWVPGSSRACYNLKDYGEELRCSFEIKYTLQWSCLKVRSQNKEAEKLSDLGVIWMIGGERKDLAF